MGGYILLYYGYSFVFGLRFYSQKKMSTTSKGPIDTTKLNSRQLGTFFLMLSVGIGFVIA